MLALCEAAALQLREKKILRTKLLQEATGLHTYKIYLFLDWLKSLGWVEKAQGRGAYSLNPSMTPADLRPRLEARWTEMRADTAG
jgi:DNA-binding IclR family transcriptional regulator